MNNEVLSDFSRGGKERILRAIRRWGILVAVGAIVSGLTALAVSEIVPKEYRATAQLFLAPASNPTSSFQDVLLGQNLAKSYVQLATTEVVLIPAMEHSGWDDLTAFKVRAQAGLVRDTSVITISFRDTDPVRSAAIANAIADSFIEQTKILQTSLQGSTTSQLEEQITAVQTDIRALDDQITAMRADLSASPRPSQSPPNRSEIQAQLLQLDASRQSKQQTLAQLLKTRDDMRLASARAEDTVSLWQRATAPLEAESPRVLLNAILGVLAGGLLTLLGVVAYSYLEDRVSDLDDVRLRLGVAPLAQIHLGQNPTTSVGKLFVRDQTTSPEAEAFRALRASLLFASVDREPTSLMITSARAGEGKSVVSANLALAFAESGKHTVLVDADLRRPSQHRLFRVTATAGLTTLLTETSVAQSLEHFRVSPRLLVIPSGPLPPNPAELLASSRMTQLIRLLEAYQGGSVVIIDTSPVLAVADPLAVSVKASGALVVVDAGRTRTTAARHAIEALYRVRANVLGAVLNKVSAAQTYYYYGYYGDYASNRGDRPSPATRRPNSG